MTDCYKFYKVEVVGGFATNQPQRKHKMLIVILNEVKNQKRNPLFKIYRTLFIKILSTKMTDLKQKVKDYAEMAVAFVQVVKAPALFLVNGATEQVQ